MTLEEKTPSAPEVFGEMRSWLYGDQAEPIRLAMGVWLATSLPSQYSRELGEYLLAACNTPHAADAVRWVMSGAPALMSDGPQKGSARPAASSAATIQNMMRCWLAGVTWILTQEPLAVRAQVCRSSDPSEPWIALCDGRLIPESGVDILPRAEAITFLSRVINAPSDRASFSPMSEQEIEAMVDYIRSEEYEGVGRSTVCSPPVVGASGQLSRWAHLQHMGRRFRVRAVDSMISKVRFVRHLLAFLSEQPERSFLVSVPIQKEKAVCFYSRAGYWSGPRSPLCVSERPARFGWNE